MAMASLLGLLDGRLRPEDYDGLSLMPSTPATPHFRTRRLALASHSMSTAWTTYALAGAAAD